MDGSSGICLPFVLWYKPFVTLRLQGLFFVTGYEISPVVTKLKLNLMPQLIQKQILWVSGLTRQNNPQRTPSHELKRILKEDVSLARVSLSILMLVLGGKCNYNTIPYILQ